MTEILHFASETQCSHLKKLCPVCGPPSRPRLRPAQASPALPGPQDWGRDLDALFHIFSSSLFEHMIFPDYKSSVYT